MKIRLVLLIILVFTIEKGITQINYQLYNDLPQGPVGGGPGYQAEVKYDKSFVLVNSLDELKKALQNSAIKKIFIRGDLQLNIESTLDINTDNLLLASDRGQFDKAGKVLPGAHLFQQNATENRKSFIAVKANNVRITGLRLSSENVKLESAGIGIDPKNGEKKMELEVDNCEMYNWGYAAIQINGSAKNNNSVTSGKVHHNYIHHNNKAGLGYGIIVNYMNANCLIAYNLFDENRHSVSANGRPNEEYTAAYNLTLNNQLGTEYDMHGFSDYNKHDCEALKKCDAYSASNNAGSLVVLQNNAVLSANSFFTLRGIPIKGAFVTNNFYKGQILYRLWRTWSETTPCKLSSPNNKEINLLDKFLWPKYKLFVKQNNLQTKSLHVQYISWSGINKWQPLFFNTLNLDMIASGDFNGDRKTDLFYSNGKKWLVSWNGTTPWESLSTSTYKKDKLIFGDFDGNGITDIFLANGSEWKVSWGGKSEWKQINTFKQKASELKFGDFDGNGTTDVFWANGTEWKVSWGGKSAWERMQTSDLKANQLSIGDFDGNGISDVFFANGFEWKVSWGGKSKWELLHTSTIKSNQLTFGDFDGNGITDIFMANGADWRISWGAKSTWELIQTSTIKTNQLTFGDFNGDRKTDILRFDPFK